MPRYTVHCALLFLAVTACYFSVGDAHSKRCCVDKKGPALPNNFTCEEPTPYCCRSWARRGRVYCCDNCKLSLYSDDCDYKGYWKYIGYAIGCLVLLFVLAGAVFGLVKLCKAVCCKRRSTVVRTAAGGAPSSSADYPRNIESVPEWQQTPKKPPEYYDIFTVSPPPAYKERPDSP